MSLPSLPVRPSPRPPSPLPPRRTRPSQKALAPEAFALFRFILGPGRHPNAFTACSEVRSGATPRALREGTQPSRAGGCQEAAR
ncbi:unnamed protein product [Urochloa humidicola]